MMKRTLILACGATAAMAAQPAVARDFVSYATTEPQLYRYAACVFAGEAETAEAQIEQCAPLKEQLVAEADAAIERFHVIERYTVGYEFRRGLREIEMDVHQSRKRKKPVPTAIVDYLRCMGEGVSAKEDYQNGDAVDYIGVADNCEENAIKPAAAIASNAEAGSIRQLYLRFQRRGRLIFPRARLTDPGSRVQLTRIMDRSFLNLGLIRKAKDG